MDNYWDLVAIPMRRFWTNVATRTGIRKTGLRKLRKEVGTCEYEDVHVMWEMLRKTDGEIGRYPPVAMGGDRKIRRRRMSHHPSRRARSGAWAAVLEWAPHNLCRDF